MCMGMLKLSDSDSPRMVWQCLGGSWSVVSPRRRHTYVICGRRDLRRNTLFAIDGNHGGLSFSYWVPSISDAAPRRRSAYLVLLSLM